MPPQKTATASRSSRFRRELARPPPDRPNWADPSGVELIYLGWGKRYYGRNPLPVTRHTGWAYIVILAGTPALKLATHNVVLRPGQMFVMHPDCASGWTDRPEGVSAIVSWIWAVPPPPEIAPPPENFRLGHGDAAQLARLRSLHAECRQEVQTADAATPRALAGLRYQLEAEYSRILSQRPRDQENEFRFSLACRWMNENLGRRRAVASLVEYLDVSPSELHRLFVQHAGCGPATYLQRQRMQKAEQLVRQGESVKAAAYALGYAHANDLSRAYRQHTGKTLT